ncbi:hypothetical protein ACRALDRAFT_209830 [Sodiomyces alcalophilus JCM 7366]|uniref:uncharacterized protein n=1 Tax=Sodiomyces alcalophilus JCM 7366 TaxID=591952 RepID=UPI0039B5D994
MDLRRSKKNYEKALVPNPEQAKSPSLLDSSREQRHNTGLKRIGKISYIVIFRPHILTIPPQASPNPYVHDTVLSK